MPGILLERSKPGNDLMAPQPDLVVILLDAPDETIQAPKREVRFAETARQREACRKLVGKLPNGVMIDASEPVEAPAHEISRSSLGYLAARRAKRLRGISQ